jgi:hypothetical protein
MSGCFGVPGQYLHAEQEFLDHRVQFRRIWPSGQPKEQFGFSDHADSNLGHGYAQQSFLNTRIPFDDVADSVGVE